jgi:two-component system nitrogen regulation response regulator NtrX
LYGTLARIGRPARKSSGYRRPQWAHAPPDRDYILRKLEDCHGNVSRAAEILGLERSHLYRKMKALGIHTKEA